MSRSKRQANRTSAPREGGLRLVGVSLVFAVLVGVALTGWRAPRAARTVASNSSTAGLNSLSDLLAVTPGQRQGLDIAHANLFCAQRLNGAQDLDMGRCLATLDEWARHVAAETARNLHQFRDNPQEFRNSEGYFRMLVLVTVLQQDLGVRYNPARMATPEQSEADSVFFADSKDLFLHGILSVCGQNQPGSCG